MVAIGQKLEEDLESKVRLLGWVRLKHVNGLKIQDVRGGRGMSG